MIGCLIITLFFIAIIIVLEKTLPDGSKSHFRPSVKGNLDDVLAGEEALAGGETPVGGMLLRSTKRSMLSY